MQGEHNKLNSANAQIKDDRHWFEKITSLIETNRIGVQLGIYGVAFCGLGIALRSVRPFKKFTSAVQIPKTFLDNHINLYGKVLNIDVTSKPALLVDHYPIFLSKFRSIGPPIRVELEGINISQNGICWLQTIVKGEPVEFKLLTRNNDSINCIVTINKRNVAERLVSLGFATVAPFNLELNSLKFFTKYYAGLLKAEERAERMGNGMWVRDDRAFSLREIITRLALLFRISFNKLQFSKIKI